MPSDKWNEYNNSASQLKVQNKSLQEMARRTVKENTGYLREISSHKEKLEDKDKELVMLRQ